MTPKQLVASGWVKGVDVSHHQTAVDWPALYADGYRFAWVKATEGADYSDPSAATHAAGANAAGFRVGAYHFARPDNGNSAVAEASNFAAELYALGETVVGGLPPVLDYERKIKRGSGAQWISVFNGELAQLIGRKPWLYSGLNTYLKHAEEGTPLWVAAYRPMLPFADRYNVWQYSGSFRHPACAQPLDVNLMHPDTWRLINR